jgi:hypothetical protein
MPVPPPAPPPVPGTRFSGLDFVRSAMRLIGVLSSGENATAAEAQDGIAILNQMLDTWNRESLMIYTRLISDFAFVAAQQTYTYGTGGNFNSPRPAEIERASVVVNNSGAQPLEVPIAIYTDQDWQKVSIKNTDSTFPLSVYDDQAFPFRNLSFWPIPRDTLSFPRLYVWSLLTQFPDLSTVLTFPPGYYEAIRYNLAIRLAPEFGTSAKPEVIALAVNAISAIKAANIPEESLTCDLGVAPGPSSRKVRNELFSIP